MARHRASRFRRSRAPRSCRSRHSYGSGTQIGAGIIRYVCFACGAVSIDLTQVDTVSSVGSLFETAEGTLQRT